MLLWGHQSPPIPAPSVQGHPSQEYGAPLTPPIFGTAGVAVSVSDLPGYACASCGVGVPEGTGRRDGPPPPEQIERVIFISFQPPLPPNQYPDKFSSLTKSCQVIPRIRARARCGFWMESSECVRFLLRPIPRTRKGR